jgi:hypothetical protein
MSLYCHECGSSNVRRAHFRLSDALRMFTFRYPVRCTTCKRRWHALMTAVRMLPHAPNRRQNTQKMS